MSSSIVVTSWDSIWNAISIVLLFCLVFGMSATVDMVALQHQLQNKQAIFTGLVLQFGIMPLLGFVMVMTLNLDFATGITLLIVTSSPGGSYSNWWCSLFNADLALSVTMTAISTLVSSIFLPMNLYLYTKLAYQSKSTHDDNEQENNVNNDNNENNDDIILPTMQWSSLIFALFVVLCAIGLGLLASAAYREANFNLRMNQLGNVAGIMLIVVSAILSNVGDDGGDTPTTRLYKREWQFYLGVALPCILGLLLANVVVTTGCWRLDKPERVTVAIECCYQNVGIATSIALTMFDGTDQTKAVAVPFYYGLVQAAVLLVYCICAWKAGWTKSPKDVSLYNLLTTSYEVVHATHGDIDPDYHAYVDHHHYHPQQQQYCRQEEELATRTRQQQQLRMTATMSRHEAATDAHHQNHPCNPNGSVTTTLDDVTTSSPERSATSLSSSMIPPDILTDHRRNNEFSPA